MRFQRRRGLAVDGVAGPQTRHALGRYGRPRLGSRVMKIGSRGWDVAALQYLLQRRVWPRHRRRDLRRPDTAAVVRAQGAAEYRRGRPGRAADDQGAARPRLPRRRIPGSGRFPRPVPGPIGDGFGAPRVAAASHQGADFPVALKHAHRAAAAGDDDLRRTQLRRLRQPRSGPAHRRLHDLVRAHVVHHVVGRRARERRHAARIRRLNGLLDRAAPALRDPPLQHADQSRPAAQRRGGEQPRRRRRARPATRASAPLRTGPAAPPPRAGRPGSPASAPAPRG